MDNLKTQLSENLSDCSHINVFVLLPSVIQSYNKEIFTRKLKEIGKTYLLVIVNSVKKKSKIVMTEHIVITQKRHCSLLFRYKAFLFNNLLPVILGLNVTCHTSCSFYPIFNSYYL